MIHLISNADDFGISDSVNDAIAKSFERKVISNTTIMVNMDKAKEARELSVAKGFDDKVGIHINLTAGEPLTDSIKKSSLFCDSDGRFNAAFHLNIKSRLHLPKAEMKYVAEEIDAQFRRYLELGFTEMHFDSHHHVHTDRPIWLAIKPLAEKYGFKTSRLGRNVYDKADAFNKIYKGWLNASIERAGLKYTDYFGSFKDYEDMWDRLSSAFSGEMMLHPMYSADGVLMDTDTPMEVIEKFLSDKKVVVEAISDR